MRIYIYIIYIYIVCVDFAHGKGSIFFVYFGMSQGMCFFLKICKPCHLQMSLAWNVWLQFDSRILVFSATANFKDKILEL